MSEQPRHCPFLNRSDARCAERFNVGHMQHAFRHCFATYKACPTYLELLVERRIKRLTESAVHAPSFTALTIGGQNRAA